MVAVAALTSASPIDWSHGGWKPAEAAQEYDASQSARPLIWRGQFSWPGHHSESANPPSTPEQAKPANWTEPSTWSTDHPGQHHDHDHTLSATWADASAWYSAHGAYSGPAPTSKPMYPATMTEASAWTISHAGLASPASSMSSSFSIETVYPADIWERDATDVTTFPNLVPTGTTVDIGTDTTGTRTISPLFMPTKVADIGVTTPGCVVSISDYSYVTSCSGGVRATAAAAIPPSITACCGGQDSLYPCMDDGRMPNGEIRWTCTMAGLSFAGLRFATTTWF